MTKLGNKILKFLRRVGNKINTTVKAGEKLINNAGKHVSNTVHDAAQSLGLDNVANSLASAIREIRSVIWDIIPKEARPIVQEAWGWTPSSRQLDILLGTLDVAGGKHQLKESDLEKLFPRYRIVKEAIESTGSILSGNKKSVKKHLRNLLRDIAWEIIRTALTGGV